MNSKTKSPWLTPDLAHNPGPPRNLAPEGAKTQVVMLGSGGVSPHPFRHGPSAAVIVNDATYIIDAGEGMWRSLAWAALSHPELLLAPLDPTRINRLFLTHLHSDHTVGLPALWLFTTTLGRKEPLSVHGPIGTKKLTDHIVQAYHGDLAQRRHGPEAIMDNPERWTIIPHEIKEMGPVYEDENICFEAFHHKHGTFEQNYAYRITTADRVICWAGDGREDGHLDKAAQGADILFCELSTEDWLWNANWGGATLEEKQKTIFSYHIRPQELADFATRMGVKTLVTMHERNYSEPFEPDALMDEFKRDYSGLVYSSRDGDIF